MNKYVKYGLIAFAGLVVLGVLADSSNGIRQTNNAEAVKEQVAEETDQQAKPKQTQTATPTPTKKVVTVNIASFIKEFDANQLAAEHKYEGKIIRTTGYVGNISEDILGNYFLILNPKNDEYYFGTSIQCFFDDKKDLLKIKNGQKITIEGEFDTQELGNIMLKHCTIKK